MASASNYPAISSALVALVDGAAGIENVHAYQRHVSDWSAMLSLFKITIAGPPATYRVHGWTVSRAAVSEEWLTNVEVIRVHEFKLRGVYGVQDSANTEDSFNDLVEALCTTLRADFTCSASAEWHEPVQFPIIDYRVFGGILCHYAEGTVKVRERLTGGG